MNKSITRACGPVLALVLLALIFGACAQETADSSGVEASSPEEAGSYISITNVSFVATSPERDNLNDEWVEIANQGDSEQSLAGWTLSDQQEHVYSFPEEFVLAAGERVKVHSGSGTDGSSDLYWNRNTPVWNNDGDTATLWDNSGEAVSSYP
ncbi:MAG: lamin tail domain-containing protein [Methanosarcinales archaeon]|nr:lamin tail domain-containing protein [Methanosarcinales archaeon]